MGGELAPLVVFMLFDF